ncbi:MAG: UMP kinase [Candidatus Magasanikbacteria bacterium]|nr:UMP kinase [Candidatus Magasanikbacteria bacterium]
MPVLRNKIKKINNKTGYKILSVGGSIIIPPTGFDIGFLKKFRALILSEVKKGQKFILVIGGGATCRQYQKAAGAAVPMTDRDLDWLGIKTTVLNAEFVKALFKDYAYEEVAVNPTKKVKTTRPIIIAAGWKPGCSTDKDAVLLAKTYGATEVINLSNVDYVYNSDPKKNKNAKKLTRLTWGELKKIVGTKWQPGANVPFDPSAARLAQKLGLVVKFARGTDVKTISRILNGDSTLGTVIS